MLYVEGGQKVVYMRNKTDLCTLIQAHYIELFLHNSLLGKNRMVFVCVIEIQIGKGISRKTEEGFAVVYLNYSAH